MKPPMFVDPGHYYHISLLPKLSLVTSMDIFTGIPSLRRILNYFPGHRLSTSATLWE